MTPAMARLVEAAEKHDISYPDLFNVAEPRKMLYDDPELHAALAAMREEETTHSPDCAIALNARHACSCGALAAVREEDVTNKGQLSPYEYDSSGGPTLPAAPGRGEREELLAMFDLAWPDDGDSLGCWQCPHGKKGIGASCNIPPDEWPCLKARRAIRRILSGEGKK